MEIRLDFKQKELRIGSIVLYKNNVCMVSFTGVDDEFPYGLLDLKTGGMMIGYRNLKRLKEDIDYIFNGDNLVLTYKGI